MGSNHDTGKLPCHASVTLYTRYIESIDLVHKQSFAVTQDTRHNTHNTTQKILYPLVSCYVYRVS